MGTENGQSNEFEPIAVGLHETKEMLPIPPTGRLGSIMVVDDATENGHPVVVMTLAYHSGELSHCIVSLRQWLITNKLIMDGYVEDVRATFGI